jgi:hypothetical protein
MPLTLASSTRGRAMPPELSPANWESLNLWQCFRPNSKLQSDAMGHIVSFNPVDIEISPWGDENCLPATLTYLLKQKQQISFSSHHRAVEHHWILILAVRAMLWVLIRLSWFSFVWVLNFLVFPCLVSKHILSSYSGLASAHGFESIARCSVSFHDSAHWFQRQTHNYTEWSTWTAICSVSVIAKWEMPFSKQFT